MGHKIYSDSDLATAVANSTCYRDVLVYLNAGLNGSSYSHIKFRINELKLDISHFIKYVPCNIPRRIKLAKDILVHDETLTRRVGVKLLRRSLISEGIVYECAICKLPPIWNDRKLILQVDHVDGDFKNNEIANLRFLCPNCHTQTPTFGYRTKNKEKFNSVKLNTILSEEEILLAISDDIRSYTELAKKLNITRKMLLTYRKQYGIELSFKSISKETFIKTLNDSNSVNDVLSKLNVTKHAYNALRKKYKINVNMNKKEKGLKMWITDGYRDIFHNTTDPIPEGYKKGKSFFKPPRKKKK